MSKYLCKRCHGKKVVTIETKEGKTEVACPKCRGSGTGELIKK